MPTENVQPAATINQDNFQLDPETNTYLPDDEAALKIILEDRDRADNFINIQQWASNWLQSDILRQSPSTSFDGIAGMTVPKFTLSNVISAVVPKMVGGLFYEKPPFLLRPRPGTKQNVVQAKTALFSYQMDQMKLEEQAERCIDQMAHLGTMIAKWNWVSKKQKIKKYVRKSESVPVDTPYRTAKVTTPDSLKFNIELEDKDIEMPLFEFCDIRTVRVDPGCRVGDIRKAKWVIHTDFATWKYLDDLRDREGYSIPSKEELIKFFMDRKSVSAKPDNLAMTMPELMRGYLQHALPRNQKSSADPLQNGLEITERVDDEKTMCALSWEDHHILIRNEANPYGKINYYSANWRDLPDAFYGQGLGQLVGAEQMVEQGTTALALGMLAYGLQPTRVRKKGFNALSEPEVWEQGGTINVEDDVDKSYKFLEFPNIPAGAWEFITYSKATAEESAGANQQFTMGAGAPGVKTTGARSGTGAAGVIQAGASRLDGPIERFCRQVLEPWIYQMDELNNDRLPTSVLNEVLAETAQDLKVDHIDFRNAKIEYEVLAGSHLGPKKEMSQFLPFLLNLVNNPTVVEMLAEVGWTFDMNAIFKAMADLSGWKYSQPFLVKMTPQQQQKRMANSPAGVAQIKGQQAQQTEAQKFRQQQVLQDDDALGKAGVVVTKTLLEHELESDQEPAFQ
jgi:hypothetical protein